MAATALPPAPTPVVAPDQQWHAPGGVAHGGVLVAGVPIPSPAPVARTFTSSVAAPPLSEGSSSTGSLGCGQSNTDGQMTQVTSSGVTKPIPEQGLLVARRSILVAQNQVDVHRIVRTLGIALGAIRMEAGTIRALHAVLLQLARPGMNNTEAYRSTGASRPNFFKWRRRVQHVQSMGGGSAVTSTSSTPSYLPRPSSTCLLPRYPHLPNADDNP